MLKTIIWILDKLGWMALGAGLVIYGTLKWGICLV